MRKDAPNIVLIMADQLGPSALPIYGNSCVKAPNIDSLAENATIFNRAYCNYPLCGPSRCSLVSGRLPSKVGGYDNAAELAAGIPTFAHYLTHLGYRTCASGKMHFIGPDQLHGFHERLTTDIYPSDFGWCPDWQREQLIYPWSHRIASIGDSGIALRTFQLDYDEEVAFRTERWIYDYARSGERCPFFLFASFTHPHNPFVTTPEYWNLYRHDDIDMPMVQRMSENEMDCHSRRLWQMLQAEPFEVTDAIVRVARHAYYGMVSYMDHKVGQLLRALETSGYSDNTVVIFAADHGEMLGERGFFFKMSFFESSVRVPLIIRAPDGRRIEVNQCVSLVDVLPTLVSLSGGLDHDFVGELDGRSLEGFLEGEVEEGDVAVLGEYFGEGTLEPCVMIRRGRHKFIYAESDPPLLFDLQEDPHELDNIATKAGNALLVREFEAEVRRYWSLASLKRHIIVSQQRRQFIRESLDVGRYNPWDFEARTDASRAYVRRGLASMDVDARTRLPVRG